MKPSGRDEMLEEAALWKARLDSREASLEQFEKWRDADPRRAIAFAKVVRTWRELSDLSPVQVRSNAPAPMRQPRASSAKASQNQWSRRAAAMALMGIGVTAGTAYWGHRKPPLQHASVGIGERRLLSFSDSVRVDLNTESALDWRKSDKLVELWLKKGELALESKPNDLQTKLFAGAFAILSGPGLINVRFLQDTLDMVVIKGSVLLTDTADRQLATIATGKRVIATAAGATVFDASALLLDSVEAWRSGVIIFRDTPLSDAIAEFNRYLERKIFIADPALNHLRIGGRFLSSNPESFLSAIELALSLKATRSAGEIVLSSKH